MERNFKRAKSKENKEIRMNEIMNATELLFNHSTYHDITLTTIAKELGMARGNLYKYVNSKEEIFLQIYINKQKEAIDQMMALLSKEETLSVSILSKIMSDVLEHSFDYIKYHQIMNTIIETNVSIEKLAEFKLNSYKHREDLFNLIVDVCQLDSPQQASDLYLTILSHCCFLYNRVAYHDTYTEAMKLADLPIIPINFKESLNHFIMMCFTHYYPSFN